MKVQLRQIRIWKEQSLDGKFLVLSIIPRGSITCKSLTTNIVYVASKLYVEEHSIPYYSDIDFFKEVMSL